ncbi:MAG: linear amide C-N hydrolase [Candidatus Sulfomarinibacteraceae bacterium]
MRSRIARVFVPVLVAAFLLPTIPADSCTSFLLRHPSGPLMAKNFDWDVSDGLLVINPRGLAKRSMVNDGAKPVRWTSRYGSLTFNQYGREFPLGGMNEAGLAMEVLWLDETVYPATADRPSIGTLQWVQYCLDSFRTVADVVASASELAISGPAKLHFIACDQTGNCAIIEFLDGKVVTRSERTLPLPVLTNNSFSDSLEYLNRTLGYGGDPITPEGTGSLARFARTAKGVHAARSAARELPVGDVFAILADVAQPDSTRWSIVYELQKTTVHFTSSGNAGIRTVNLAALDLDCTGEPLMLDLLAEGSGDVTSKLVPYSAEKNLETLEAGLKAKKVTAPNRDAIDARAAYPETLSCTFE